MMIKLWPQCFWTCVRSLLRCRHPFPIESSSPVVSVIFFHSLLASYLTSHNQVVNTDSPGQKSVRWIKAVFCPPEVLHLCKGPVIYNSPCDPLPLCGWPKNSLFFLFQPFGSELQKRASDLRPLISWWINRLMEFPTAKIWVLSFMCLVPFNIIDLGERLIPVKSKIRDIGLYYFPPFTFSGQTGI